MFINHYPWNLSLVVCACVRACVSTLKDLGEFGIAPKRVSTRQDFTHPEHEHAAVAREETQRNVFDAHHQSIIPGVAPLHDLVIPAR